MLWSFVVLSGTALLIQAFRAPIREVVPLAASFLSALSTVALLRRSQLQRGESFMLAMLAPVAFSSFWAPLSSSEAKSVFDVGVGMAMAVFGAAQHLMFLRLRRGLDEPTCSV